MTQPEHFLTPGMRKAVEALAAGQTLTQAAITAGVSRKSIYRWRMEHEGFQQALAAAQHMVYSETIGGIVAASVDAIATLREIAVNPKTPASARVSAALGILNHAHTNYRTAIVEARLDELEGALDEQQ